MQQLSPIGWALRPLKNYANFSGRASRAEFWWFFLFMMIVYFAFWIVLFAAVGASFAPTPGGQPSFGMLGAFGVLGIFMMLFYLAMLLPTIAVQVRRLHDTDRSGWWIGGFYLGYVIYFVALFGMARVTPGSGTPPNMGSFAAVGIIAPIMFVYAITLLVFFCIEGTRGANRFGEDPYGPNVEQVFA